MTTLSSFTVVRNGVQLRYPLEASLQTYYPLCDEVVISYDPTSEDGTEDLVLDLVRRYPRVRAIPSAWNLANRTAGSEIAVRSNVALRECTSDWVLYVQADEAIHEGDYDILQEALEDPDANGVLFDRWSFFETLEREIPEHFTRNLLRLFRRGQGRVVEDGRICGLLKGVRPSIFPRKLRMFNYSRMGAQEERLLRAWSRDQFYIHNPEGINKSQALESNQNTRLYDPSQHPVAVRSFYEAGPSLTAGPNAGDSTEEARPKEVTE